MAKTLKEVDAVMVGMGWTGSIMARELTKAGPQRGRARARRRPHPARGFHAAAAFATSCKYAAALELMQDNSIDTHHLPQHARSELALPIRRWGAFLPGDGVGGTGMHWGGITGASCRPISCCAAHLDERYGAKAIPDDMTIQDWPRQL